MLLILTYEENFENVRKTVLSRIDIGNEVSDQGIKETIEEALGEYCREFYVPLVQRQSIYNELFYQLRALDILQELVENPEVTEIMVNGPDNIFIEKAGRIIKWNRSFTAPDKLDNVIQQIVGFCNRVVNESSPIVDARLPDGSRVNVVLKPVALNGPILTIRRFPTKRMTMEDLLSNGAITKEAADFLEKLVIAKYNLFISGDNDIIGLSQVTSRTEKATAA